MKTKSLVVLQALLLLLGTASFPAYSESDEADSHGSRAAEGTVRPEAASGSKEFYEAIYGIIKDSKDIEFKNDLDKDVKLAEKFLDEDFSRWVDKVLTIQARIASDCKDKKAGKQLDELLRNYAQVLSTEMKAAVTTKPGDTVQAQDKTKPVVSVKALLALTEAIQKTYKTLIDSSDDKASLRKQRDELVKMLDKINASMTGIADKKDLPEGFKSFDLAKVSIKDGKTVEAAITEEMTTLSEIVAAAKESSGDVCLTKPSSGVAEIGGAGSSTSDIDKLRAEMKAKEEAAKKAAEEAKKKHEAEVAELRKKAEEAERRQRLPEKPAPGLGNAAGAGGTAQTDGNNGGAGGDNAGGGAGSNGGGGTSSGTPDGGQLSYPDLNGFVGNGLNGGLGDLLALKDQLQRDFDDQLAEQQLLDAARLAQIQQPQIPAINSRSATPAPPAPPANPPVIPPMNFGGGGGQPPPYPPMGPMPQPMPMMPPPMGGQPVPPPPVVKTTTEEVKEEGFVPNPMPMVQPLQPMGPPQPPTVVNEVFVTVRLPNGQVTTMPLSQVPQGATVLSTVNPNGGTQLTSTGAQTSTTSSNVSSIASGIAGVNTSNRGGGTATTQSSGSNNLNSSNPNGQRGGLTF